jgi:hypothetical protein
VLLPTFQQNQNLGATRYQRYSFWLADTDEKTGLLKMQECCGCELSALVTIEQLLAEQQCTM